jgi:aminoglycoside 3-N-acetyltransferase
MPASSALTSAAIESHLRDDLGLTGYEHVLAHVYLRGLGPVEGEDQAVLEALLAITSTLIMPGFTYQTQVIPQIGPPDNAMEYGTGDEVNARAEFFRPDLPIHADFGRVAEALRRAPGSLRSTHPILSFVAHGRGAKAALSSQTPNNPLGPMGWLEAHDGLVLLMGHDQRHNYSLHLAEQRFGRKTFVRWALTHSGVEELAHIPGCMEGFNAIWRDLLDISRATQIGLARCEIIPIKPLLAYAEKRLHQDPNFLLCEKPSCLSCRAREQ